MTDHKFRAVLTLIGHDKILEMRFDGLNEQKTHVECIVNQNNRHIVNEKEFLSAIMNLVGAFNNYVDKIMSRYFIGKLTGLM